MKIKVLNDEGIINIHNISKDDYSHSPLKNNITYIGSSSKEENSLNIINSYINNKKSILFDNTNKIISSQVDNLDIFTKQDFSMLFFTSGSTGNPIGALKTKQNLEDEVKVFSKLIQDYNIKQVIVTVPFIHIYGTLIGLLYPLLNNIDIILKEHFLPNDLINIIDDNSLIVTTPLYIKALNKITKNKDLNKSLFISSTAPLDKENAKRFCEKFNTNIMQLFGSTETSGIAYKYNDDEMWLPLDSVKISTNNENELKVKSPFVSDILFENGFRNTNGEIQTFDYIEMYNEKFKLIGRSSKIFKIAGKRYSTVQIENILEDIDEISNALVFVDNSDNNLRDEILNITLESKKEFTRLEIKKILKSKLSNLKFSIKLNYVDKIPTNIIGKKLLTLN
ncbi:MAG: aconitate hydratase [Epsilonproteobacteria bacterium]|nr:MAG: aconitate hydratase [Campylobacterota bacterium]